jgi:hypothetical protein
MSAPTLVAAPTRIYIKVINWDIPGAPTERLRRLLEDVFTFLGRDFKNSIDYVHVPGVIDSAVSQVAWLVVDLNVGQKGQDLDSIPIRCYKASYHADTPYVDILPVQFLILLSNI